MVTHDQVKLIPSQQADRPAALDALLGAALMLLTLGPVIEVTHQVHDFTFDALQLGRFVVGAEAELRYHYGQPQGDGQEGTPHEEFVLHISYRLNSLKVFC